MEISKANRVLAVALVLVVLISLFSACGNASQSAAQPPAGNASDTPSSDESGNAPYSFVMYMNYDWYDISPVWGEDETSKLLKEKFNIDLILSKPDTDPDTKMNLMLASDDLPDAMMLDRKNAYFSMAQNGQLVNLDGFIDNGSNYQQLLAQNVRDSAKINGSTYGILNWPTDATAPTGNKCVALNKSIYESFGSPKLDTLDELYAYLQMVYNDAGMREKSVVPLQPDYWDDIGDIYSLYGGFLGLLSTTGLYENGDKLEVMYKDPKFLEAALFTNKLYNENLINQDFFLEKNEQILEKLATGRAAVIFGNISDRIRPSRLRLQEMEPDNDYIIIEPPAAAGVNQKDIKMDLFHTIGWNVLVITNKAEKPERIFELFDYMFSVEGTVEMYYGPQGNLWTEKDADGYPLVDMQRYSNLQEDEKKQIGLFIWSFPGNSIVADRMGAAGLARTPEEDRDPIEVQQRAIVWPHSQDFTEFSAIVNDITLNDPNSEYAIFKANYLDVYNKELIPKLISSKTPEELETLLNRAIDEVNAMGAEAYANYCTELWANSK